jgi:hypothetical protein
VIGKFYMVTQPRYAGLFPGWTVVVKVLAKWNGRGPRNVLVEWRMDDGKPQHWFGGPTRWVRPFRGLKRYIGPDLQELLFSFDPNQGGSESCSKT